MKQNYCWYYFTNRHTGEPEGGHVCPVCSEQYQNDPTLTPSTCKDAWLVCSCCHITYKKWEELCEVGK